MFILIYICFLLECATAKHEHNIIWGVPRYECTILQWLIVSHPHLRRALADFCVRVSLNQGFKLITEEDAILKNKPILPALSIWREKKNFLKYSVTITLAWKRNFVSRVRRNRSILGAGYLWSFIFHDGNGNIKILSNSSSPLSGASIFHTYPLSQPCPVSLYF